MDRELMHASDGLSQAGNRRRQEMLAELQRVVVARGRRRIAGRIAIAGAGLACFALAVALALRPATPPAPSIPAPRIADLPAPLGPGVELPAPSSIVGASTTVATDAQPRWSAVPRIRVVATSLIRPAQGDAEILERARYRGVASIPAATDDSLAHALRAAGKEVGVARTPDAVILLPDRPAVEG